MLFICGFVLVVLVLVGKAGNIFWREGYVGGWGAKDGGQRESYQKSAFSNRKGQQLLTRALLHAESNRLCRIRRERPMKALFENVLTGNKERRGGWVGVGGVGKEWGWGRLGCRGVDQITDVRVKA